MKITNTYVKNASHFLHNRVAKQLHLTKACCIATLLCAANLQAATNLADNRYSVATQCQAMWPLWFLQSFLQC